MKYFTLFFICFLFSYTVPAQIQSGEIIYKVRMTDNFNKFKDTIGESEHIKKLYIRTYNNLKKTALAIEHKLIFNTKKAISEQQKVMDVDNNGNLESAMAWTFTTGNRFYDFENRTKIHQFKEFDKDILLQTSMDSISWNLEDEFKMIQGYKCQKATTDKYLARLFNKKITVWFTPELPFQIGPIGTSGLPGTILEVERNGIHIYADEIKLHKNLLEIAAPKKGTLMSTNEYREFVMKNDPRAKKVIEEKQKSNK